MFDTRLSIEILKKRVPSLLIVDATEIDFSLAKPLPDICSETNSLCLNTHKVVFFIGCSLLLENWQSINKWLEIDSCRRLYIVEINPAYISCHLKEKSNHSWISHPQITFIYAESFTKASKHYFSFVPEQVDKQASVIVGTEYEKDKEAMALKNNLELALVRSQYETIDIWCHTIFYQNFYNNIQKSHTFREGNALFGKFSSCPIVVIGAAPSLEKEKKHLRELQTKAIIIACGSAISILDHWNIKPHFIIALDSSPEESEIFRNSNLFDVPLFIRPRVNCSVLEENCSPTYFLRGGGVCIEKYFEQKFYHKRCSKETTIHEGWSVVCLATHLAILMGSTQVYLLGIDLAYTEEKEYAAHAYIEKNSYVNAVKEKDWFGLQEVHHQTSGPILTRWRWLAEQEYLSEMLSFFSPRITSYNLSSHGLEIKGSIQSTLKEILLDLRQKDYEGKKHLYAIQSPKVSWEKAEVKVFIESVADNTLYLQNWFETQLTNFDEIIDRIKDSKTREYCYILLFRNKICIQKQVIYKVLLKDLEVSWLRVYQHHQQSIQQLSLDQFIAQTLEDQLRVIYQEIELYNYFSEVLKLHIKIVKDALSYDKL